jgi:hypothetical protein
MESVSGQESGVMVYGEQRGAAVCDYDEDGRVDLVVTQNGERTRLYHNVGAKPGLRVRLEGPEGNREGVGARLRLQFQERQGAMREIHAGSGYWSQDGAKLLIFTNSQRVWRRQTKKVSRRFWAFTTATSSLVITTGTFTFLSARSLCMQE